MANLLEREAVIEKTVVNLRSTLCTLNTIWKDIGLIDEECDIHFQQAIDHINDLLQDMIHEAKQKKDALLSNVKDLMKKLFILTKELGGDTQKTVAYEKLPLKEIEEALRNDLNILQQHKDQRLTLFKELHAKEQYLCKILGTKPIEIGENLPSEEKLNSFKLYLEKQEMEKNYLESNFKEMHIQIIEIMDELGISPFTNFEHLVYKNRENFVFNKDNMTKLKKLKEKLQDRLEVVKEYAENIKQELIVLWKYLDEPEQICNLFLNSHEGYNVATVHALEAELERCKEKRKQNITQCVLQVRSEIVKLWDQCKFDEAQKNEFKYFHYQTYTEDLLTLHELEVKRLQEFYAANKSIFELLEERNKLWSRMKELLQPPNDPDRFHNRGGQLLIEEKERKMIKKKLPKLEEQLKNLIKIYESESGKKFTINGISVEKLLKESWEHLNEEKETIKKARKNTKDKLGIVKSASSSTKRTPTVLSTRRHTPTNILQRRRLFTPSPNTSLKRRHLSLKNSGCKQKKRSIPRILTPSCKDSKKGSNKENSPAADTAYAQFKEHLDKQKELRSSLLPEQVLLNATIQEKDKTPMRTPANSLGTHVSQATSIITTPKLSHSQLHKSPRSLRRAESSKLAVASDLFINF